MWVKSATHSRSGAAGLKCRRISSARRSVAAAGVVVVPGTVHRAAQGPHVPSCSQISGPHGPVAASVMPVEATRKLGRPGPASDRLVLRELLG